ncbi:hypothetical protein [Oribacterium sp. WCC10]|uniref:hypothetical protein n=1 Tax=Oribacterium sp. WCC10 TaxID=1855343 RepID=UPI0008F04804|nr:hypothetical protein [Oribacterium sp. WCC10]SFG48192.1 hypothetical protein SAMN05216356_11045 [Oribacterium sp. WCC10]
MNKNYFKWLIKSRKISLLFFFLICIGFQLISFTNYDACYPSDTFNMGVIIGGSMSMLLCIAMPVFILSYIHRKSSADLYLALPVSRKEQLLTTFFLTWIMAYGTFFIGTTLIWVTKTFSLVSFKTWISVQILTAFSLLVLMLVYTAIYTLANSVFDGIVMIGAYSVLPGVVALSVLTFLYSMIAGNNVPSDSFILQTGTLLSPVSMFFSNLNFLLEPEYSSQEKFSRLYILMMLGYGLIAIALLRYHFINRKAERTDQISDDKLSYPFIINAYLILILLSLAWSVVSDSVNGFEFFYLLLFFIYIVASFVYKRTLRITWRPIAFFIFACLATLVFAKIGWMTEGFGLSHLPHELFTERYLHYNYSADVSIDNLGEQIPDYNHDYAYISFDLSIPSEKAAEYAGLIDKFEALRNDAVTNFYKSSKDMPNTNVSLSVYNNTGNDSASLNYYNYNRVPPLSEEDLKTISRYCEVTIYPIINKNYDDDGSLKEDAEDEYLGDMDLDKFIDWRDSKFRKTH